jgi:ribosomal-protein-alanine N-acetyltransferase
MKLERLAPEQAAEVLRFERENRAYFAGSIPDRGDDYFAEFPARHAALLEDQATGRCHLHVLVDAEGAVLGRFNLFDVESGEAELGFRVAERVAGQGVAKEGVRLVIARARDDYGLVRLRARAALANAGSRGVLRASGFVPVGDVTLNGRPGLRYTLTLAGK